MLSENTKKDITFLVKKIWENPELSGEENFACMQQMAFMRQQGFSCISPVAEEKTAYKAQYMVKGRQTDFAHIPSFAFCAEYDALPKVKHGCGHHLIMGSAIAAALDLKLLLEENHISGKILLLGCPAEETYGGKCRMADCGITDEFDAVLMAHPTGGTAPLGDTAYSGLKGVKVIYHGTGGSPAARMANPAFNNPLDAQTLLYQGIAMRRHFFPRDTAVSGVITEGGLRANMLPVTSESSYTVRSQDPENLEKYTKILEEMAKGAALMTGTEVEIIVSKGLLPTRPNSVFNTAYLDNMEKKGYKVDRTLPGRGRNFAATDFGAFSQKKIGSHVHFPIMEEAAAHTEKFYLASIEKAALQSMFDAGESMAETAFAFIQDKVFRSAAEEAFRQDFFEI